MSADHDPWDRSVHPRSRADWEVFVAKNAGPDVLDRIAEEAEVQGVYDPPQFAERVLADIERGWVLTTG